MNSMRKKRMRRMSSSMVFDVFNYLLFGILAFVCIYPMWYVFIYAISDPTRVRTETVILYPLGISFYNIEQVLKLNEIGHAIFITLSRTVLGTLLTLFCCMLLGFIFSKEKFPARTFLYRTMIITMYVSGGMIPTFLVYRSYGLLNTFWVYIIPSMVAPYYVILIKTYMEQIPASLEESALIDGAGILTVLMRIIFPMAKPIAATIATYTAVNQWNSWFDNHIYNFLNPKLNTLQYLLYKYMNEAEKLMKEMLEGEVNIDLSEMLTPFGVKMTVTLIAIIPILMVYPFLQRYIVKGVMIGAVKG